MRNINFAHQFFYDDNQNRWKENNNVSYYDNKYFSYSTCIAKITQSKKGEFILLISDNNFSHTTTKHISEIRQANPRYKVLYFPQKYGAYDFDLSYIKDTLIKSLDFYASSKHTQKANRQGYINNFEMLKNLDEYLIDINKAIFDKYKPLFDILTNDESLKKELERVRKKESEKRKALKIELKTHLDNNNLLNLSRLAYSDFSELKSDIKSKIKSLINPKDDFSFVWVEGEKVKTSKYISMSIDEIKPFLLAWKKGLLKHGQNIKQYAILSITDDFVKIGCHKIPVENIKNLYSEIF